uniref:Uncharacterized protein n=1 Tax=Gracilaria vermiculophylla TaxID=2608709 RepID=A0A346Q011_9FLOR|nr:hypothetical protein [Gracilaria vermiculophylla]
MKKMQKFVLASFMSIANVFPLELPQTNFFYKGDPEIIRLRDAFDNEVNVEIAKDVRSGVTSLKRGSLPTIYVYISKNQKDFRKTISKGLRKPINKKAVSLADSELIALTKHLMARSKMLRKYKDMKLQEVIEILSCVDKAVKIKNDQIPIGFDTQEEIDKLLGQVTRAKRKVFDESESKSLENQSQNQNVEFENEYYTD